MSTDEVVTVSPERELRELAMAFWYDLTPGEFEPFLAALQRAYQMGAESAAADRQLGAALRRVLEAGVHTMEFGRLSDGPIHTVDAQSHTVEAGSVGDTPAEALESLAAKLEASGGAGSEGAQDG